MIGENIMAFKLKSNRKAKSTPKREVAGTYKFSGGTLTLLKGPRFNPCAEIAGDHGPLGAFLALDVMSDVVGAMRLRIEPFIMKDGTESTKSDLIVIYFDDEGIGWRVGKTLYQWEESK